MAAAAIPVLSARAQGPRAAASHDQHLPAVGSRVRLRAEGIFGGLQSGTVLRQSTDTITLEIRGEPPVAVPLSRISRLETSTGISRTKGAIRGAVVVSAVAAGIVVLDGTYGTRFCDPGEKTCDGSGGKKGVSASAVTESLLIGTSLGAFLGSFWPVESWQSVYLDKLSVGVLPRGAMVAGIRLAIR